MGDAEHGGPPGRPRAGRRLPALLGAGLLLGLAAVAGCDSPTDDGRREVHPEVETRYDEAVRTSVSEVPGGHLTVLDLRQTSGDAPVWHTEVVAEDGAVHTFTLDASTGSRVTRTPSPPPTPTTPSPTPETTSPSPGTGSPGPETAAPTPGPGTRTPAPEPPAPRPTGSPTATPVPEETAPARTMALVEEAVLLPEEAARKVTKPDYGKVTRIELARDAEGRAVWRIDVTTDEERNVHRYDVDAVSGEVLRRSPVPRTPTG